MVRNPITRRSGGFLEAGWLTAIAVAPVLFNAYSARAFDNSGLVRSIAFLMAAVGFITLAGRWWLARGSPTSAARPNVGFAWWPLLLAVAALALSVLASTLLSVSPAMSWWGSDEQGQGALTQLSYLVLFTSVAVSLREAGQVRRLLDTVVLTSLPVGMYSMLQRLDIDPIRWSAENVGRGGSTLGNAGFLGGYLVLVIPPTVFMLHHALTSQHSSARALQPPSARVWVYGFALALQLLALQHSDSRGPILGLAGATFLCLAAFACGSLRRGWLTGIVALGAAAAIGLVLLNVPGGPLQPLRGSVGRFSHLLELSNQSNSNTSQTRVLIWEAAAGLLSSHAPLTYNDGGSDGLNGLRPFFGYGAGTTSGTLARFVPATIEQYDLADVVVNRAHNLTFDVAIAGGLVGLAAYFAVFAGLMYAATRELWLGSRLNWGRFAIFAVVGVALGALMGAALGPAWLGLLLAAGLLLGIGSHLLVQALSVRKAGRKPANLLILALTAALVGHFIETQFEFEVNATSTYFWVFAGLLAALCLHQGLGKAAGDGAEGFQSFSTAMSILCLLGVALVYDFVKQPGGARNLLEAVWISFTTVPTGGRNVSYGVLALVLVTWLAAIIVGSDGSGSLAGNYAEAAGEGPLHAQEPGVARGRQWVSGLAPRSASLLLVVPPAVCLAFAGCHLWLLNRHGSGPLTAANLLAVAMDRASIFGSLNIWLLVLSLPLAVALGRGPRPAARFRSSLRTSLATLLGALVLGGTGVGIMAANVRPTQAGMLLAVSTSDFTGQVRLLAEQQAAWLAPAAEAPHLDLAQTYLLLSRSPLTEAPEDALRNSELETTAAAALNPLDPRIAVMRADVAREHARLASNAGDAGLWQAAVDRDLGLAVELEPNRPLRWRDWADLAARDERDYPLAFNRLEQAFTLDPKYNGPPAFQGLWNGAAPRPQLAEQQFRFAVDLAGYEAQSDALAGDDRRLISRLLVAASAHDGLDDEAGAYARRKRAASASDRRNILSG